MESLIEDIPQVFSNKDLKHSATFKVWKKAMS